MSLLATLGLELDRALLPASGLGWLVDYGKLPLAPAPLGPYEVLGGALEGGLPGGGEPLAGDGFSDWMTERVGDRKQKKRDQNKSAALRYRQRKRAEGEALEGECQGLEARNRELRERAESVEREIQYVKDLLIEVYKARSQRPRSS
ncbi:PREDICTED: cyclic AMP-dependent transcription factor ATF-5 [Condylura cristata]|uniref:cyclic AMP-dependent transcription factor ATF-5 n=1 Tax=Condylura cristata TaxID=143302 RepID=UPI000642AA0A|nr:PREDICTED: cyclic AMP-dependent transcription factor ATF-5 [Condylura cristata]